MPIAFTTITDAMRDLGFEGNADEWEYVYANGIDTDDQDQRQELIDDCSRELSVMLAAI
tara:strand:- start:76 stop:252 length:177 start_codon:yes stop_codon:yes gene_type:complete